MPKVSIIVPVYNVEKYLNRCVSSLVRQTLQDIEILLVDDGSPDLSPMLCDQWRVRDSRIKVIHKKNEGLGYARNSGLSIASSEYVAFVDSDDYVELDMYQKLYEECKEYNLDCIYSEFNVDDYPGFRVIPREEQEYIGRSNIERLRLDIVGAEPSFISGVKYHCSSCKGLYSLKLIKAHQIEFESEREYISEDMLFNLSFLYYSERVKIVPYKFYHYCLNGSSLTHVYRPDRWEKLLKMLSILDDDSKYEDKAELKLRVKRTAIFYTMTALKQEKKRLDISFWQKVKVVNTIGNNPVITEYIKDYPISKLPMKWMVYSLVLKYHLLGWFFFLF